MHEGVVNNSAVDYVVSELDKMIVHFRDVNLLEIRGASIFLVLDHEKEDYKVKLIDLASMELKEHQDEGFLKGLTECRTRFASFKTE